MKLDSDWTKNIQRVTPVLTFYRCLQNTMDEALKIPPSAPSVVVSDSSGVH